MHVISIKYLKHKCTSYIYSVISKNMGYAPGLALGRWWVNKVSTKRLRGSLLHKDLLLVLLNDLLIVLFVHRHKLYQLVIYMHEMMKQHLVIRQQQLLKYEYICQATKLVLPTKVLRYLLLPQTSMKHGMYYLSN